MRPHALHKVLHRRHGAHVRPDQSRHVRRDFAEIVFRQTGHREAAECINGINDVSAGALRRSKHDGADPQLERLAKRDPGGGPQETEKVVVKNRSDMRRGQAFSLALGEELLTGSAQILLGARADDDGAPRAERRRGLPVGFGDRAQLGLELFEPVRRKGRRLEDMILSEGRRETREGLQVRGRTGGRIWRGGFLGFRDTSVHLFQGLEASRQDLVPNGAGGAVNIGEDGLSSGFEALADVK